jgi:NAD dependent epimerase/dehydratase family enzyme
MKWPFFFGVGGVIGSGNQYVPWIHVEDLAALYVHLIEHPTLSGPFNGVAPTLTTNRVLNFFSLF